MPIDMPNGCQRCNNQSISFVVTALEAGAAIFGSNRRTRHYVNHSRVLPEGSLKVMRAVDGTNHTEVIDALLRSGVAFHALSKRPAWRWGTLACWLSKYSVLQQVSQAQQNGYTVFLEEDVTLGHSFCEFVRRGCARFLHRGASGAAGGDRVSPNVLQMSSFAEVFMMHASGATRVLHGLRDSGIRRSIDQQLLDPRLMPNVDAVAQPARTVIRYRGRELFKAVPPNPPYILARPANTGDIMSSPRISWAEAALMRLQTVPAARRLPAFGNPPGTDRIIWQDSGQYDGRHFSRYSEQ